MKKKIKRIGETAAGCLLVYFFFVSDAANAQVPTYDVYITNDSLTSFTTYEFDVMIRANGATTSFNLKTIQAGLYVNPAFTAANTIIGSSVVAGSSQMAGAGYNGSFQWNNTDKVLNMGFNTASCAVPTVVTTIPLRIARIRMIGFLGFGCGAPNLQFNYNPLPLPMLRLRTEVIIWDALCNSITFYPPGLGSLPTFNGELWTQADADGRSPVSTLDNNSPVINLQPTSQYTCSGNSVIFNVAASAPVFPSGGSLTYQWQRNCGSGFVDIPSANSPSYTLNPVTTGDNNCQFRCVVGYTCGGTLKSNPATLTTFVATESHAPILCNGGSTTVTIGGLNGTPPYTGTGAFIQSAGTVTYPVSDANACNASITVTLTEPTLLAALAGSNGTVCAGDSILLNASASGGTPPYTYSWTGPAAFSASIQNPSRPLSTLAMGGTYTVTVTDDNGCTQTATSAVSITSCTISLNVKFYIQGYYSGAGLMQPCLFNSGVAGATTLDCDTAMIQLYAASSLVTPAYAFTGIVKTNGVIACTFPGTANGNYFYIVIRHRNTVETWSGDSVLLGPVTSYNFNTSASQAYGNNMVSTGDGNFATWSGDVTQDGIIESSDYTELENAVPLFLTGYQKDDLTGDGLVESADYTLIENNVPLFIVLQRP